MKKINTQKQKGFTLLETLVAIFILTLSITGPVYIASLAFRNTIDSRDNISAQYLAEEVIEVVKNKRDKYALGSDPLNPWLISIDITECLNNLGLSDKKCTMTRDINSGDYLFEECLGGPCQPISFNPSNDFNVYGEEGIVQTSKFTREFYVEKETSAGSLDTGVKIVVNIKWNDKGREKIYTLTERLYDVDYTQFYNN